METQMLFNFYVFKGQFYSVCFRAHAVISVFFRIPLGAPFVFPNENRQILGIVSQPSACYWEQCQNRGEDSSLRSDEIFVSVRQRNLSCPTHHINWFRSAEPDLQHFLAFHSGVFACDV